MKQNQLQQDCTWLSATSRVLHERPERLQHLIMQIANNSPEMGRYASDLARLRMSGIIMENMLFKIWKANSSRQVDQIILQSYQFEHPCTGALTVLADLIKKDLSGRNNQPLQTVH
ncbi:MAG: hypothetical protein DSY50_04460 [Desulfobulbus sp.]|nr:MAG: hypothetical protein DSY50_04460 [Desulfobulbus sp.]RUM39115.1 MAG: hypothetical protein DSY58_01020 [Desulfobulbus sp.]